MSTKTYKSPATPSQTAKNPGIPPNLLATLKKFKEQVGMATFQKALAGPFDAIMDYGVSEKWSLKDRQQAILGFLPELGNCTPAHRHVGLFLCKLLMPPVNLSGEIHPTPTKANQRKFGKARADMVASWEDKPKVLGKMEAWAAVLSKKSGLPAPKVEWYDGDSGGLFKRDTMTILVHRSNSPEWAMHLILHEFAHYEQHVRTACGMPLSEEMEQSLQICGLLGPMKRAIGVPSGEFLKHLYYRNFIEQDAEEFARSYEAPSQKQEHKLAGDLPDL